MLRNNYGPTEKKLQNPENVRTQTELWYVDASAWSDDDIKDTERRIAKRQRAIDCQKDAERSYQPTYEPLDSDATPSVSEVVRRMELDHVVKEVPLFSDQCSDTSRTNKITYLEGLQKTIGSKTDVEEYMAQRRTVSENQALTMTNDFFDALVKMDADYWLEEVEPYRNSLNFIGEKELNEACRGIAEYWKFLLSDESRQLLISPVLVSDARSGCEGRTKSDEYMFEKVMEHFTDEELQGYGERIVTNKRDIEVADPSDLTIIFLEDWSVSGTQMSRLLDACASDPTLSRYLDRIEVHLAIATNEQLQHGADHLDTELPAIVRSYYRAKPKAISYGGEVNAFVTGSHSSVDFGFAKVIEEYMQRARSHAEYENQQLPEALTSLPSLASIVRPYQIENTKNKA